MANVSTISFFFENPVFCFHFSLPMFQRFCLSPLISLPFLGLEKHLLHILSIRPTRTSLSVPISTYTYIISLIPYISTHIHTCILLHVIYTYPSTLPDSPCMPPRLCYFLHPIFSPFTASHCTPSLTSSPNLSYP